MLSEKKAFWLCGVANSFLCGASDGWSKSVQVIGQDSNTALQVAELSCHSDLKAQCGSIHQG